MILHSSDEMSLIYLRERGLIYFTIVGFTKTNAIRELFEQLKENREKIKSDKLLFDTSKLGVMRQIDQNIFLEELMPLFREIGIKKTALIKTSDAFGQGKIKALVSSADNEEIQVFDDMITAERWLLACVEQY